MRLRRIIRNARSPASLLFACFFVFLCKKWYWIEERNGSGDESDWSPPQLRIVRKEFGKSKSSDQRLGNPRDVAQGQQSSSSSSQSHVQWCKFPKLDINDSSVLRFYRRSQHRSLQCSRVEKNWIDVRHGTFYVDPEAQARHGQIQCRYANVLRGQTDEDPVDYASDIESDFKNGSRLRGDFFKVDCHARDGSTYSNVHAAIRPKEEVLERKSTPGHLNVYMLGIDSLSRLAYMRNLPKSYDYFVRTMNGLVLEGYNIVGDGTPQALIPILTGKTEEELPLTRKRYANANYVNVYPFVWKEYERAGYVTLFGEDNLQIATFSHRLKGFKEQPTDHYMRTFYTVAESEANRNHLEYCWGSEEHPKTHFRYVEHLWNSYPNQTRKFAFQFYVALSHDDYTGISMADNILLEHLKFFVENGHTNDSILILMSDHGHRFGPVRGTPQGKLEERLPFFAFAFPPGFQRKYPRKLEAFRTNTQRLVTPFDIHETLVEILQLRNDGDDAETDRGKTEIVGVRNQQSLFHEVPLERTCSDAGIAVHFCTCLSWESISIRSPIVRFIAQSLVEAINRETESERALCSKLTLDRIEKAAKYSPSSSVFGYRGVKDADGFEADLSGRSSFNVEYYQVDIWTKPGQAHYEASATWDRMRNELSIDLDSVSVVNAYGDKPHCVMEKNYFLLKWQAETLVERLDLDGLNEYHKSKNKLVKLFWFCVTSTMYVTAATLSYLTITRYDLGKTIVSVEYRPPTVSVTFPWSIGMCFGASWNKTYLEEAIPVHDEILQKAALIGLATKSQVLSEFAKYLSYYNYFYFDDEQNIREDIWALMKELYEFVFKNYQMADIAQDGIIRSKVFRCWYNGRKYPCDRALSFSADTPSCHFIPIDYQYQSRIQYHTFERASLKVDISLPIKDTFHDDPRESRSTSNAGVKLVFSQMPTPFNPHWVVPANTHAVVLFHHRNIKLKSKCAGDSFLYTYKQSEIYDPEFHWFKTYETCLANVFEYASRNVCGCYLAAGTYFPSNDLACTPDQVRNCVQPRLLDAVNEERYVEQTRKCLYHCTVDNMAASITYYDLEDVSNESIRNVITIRPNLEQGFYHEEHDLANFYAAFSEVGGVIGVYTGFSIALFVRVLGLFCVAGLHWAIPRFVKPALMAAMRINTPLNARWNVGPHWFHRHRMYEMTLTGCAT